MLYKEIIDHFELEETDTVFFSSDITKLALYFKNAGHAFNPDKFIDCLQAKLTNGTIIVPAYTDLLKNGDVFDRQKSKPTTGALSNRVFRRKDFYRTNDPLHSVFVWGAHAEKILNLRDESTFGENSIFGFLNRTPSKMIILDVHFQDSFTFVHYIEEKHKVHFRKPFDWKMIVKDDEEQVQRKVVFYTKKPGYLVDLIDLQEKLIQEGTVVRKEIFGCSFLCMDVQQTAKSVENYLRKGGKTYSFSSVVWIKAQLKKILR